MSAMLRLLKDKLRRRQPDPEEGRPILHISDTPWTTFAFVERLVRRHRPAWIVHTGDLVDGAKVDLFPQAAVLYRKRAVRLIQALEQSGAEIYWVMGNHDIPEFIRRTVRSGGREAPVGDVTFSAIFSGAGTGCGLSLCQSHNSLTTALTPASRRN